MSARYEQIGRVAVVTLDNPPVNGLAHDTRSAIVEGVDRANTDETCDAIVLTGAGKTFSGGADIREFNTPKASARITERSAGSSSRWGATIASPTVRRRLHCRK